MSATKEQIEAIIAYIDTAVAASREKHQHEARHDSTKESADQAEAMCTVALTSLREISP